LSLDILVGLGLADLLGGVECENLLIKIVRLYYGPISNLMAIKHDFHKVIRHQRDIYLFHTYLCYHKNNLLKISNGKIQIHPMK